MPRIARKLTKENVMEDILGNVEVNSTTGCWIWSGSCSNRGYGKKYYGSHYSTHRLVAWAWKDMPLKSESIVCHTCDNPPCCNPDHLVVADQSWNIKDAYKKGRIDVSKENNPNSKVSIELIKEIRGKYQAGGVAQKELCEIYDLSPAHIHRIVRGKRWYNI
jgi:hypothetical protein